MYFSVKNFSGNPIVIDISDMTTTVDIAKSKTQDNDSIPSDLYRLQLPQVAPKWTYIDFCNIQRQYTLVSHYGSSTARWILSHRCYFRRHVELGQHQEGQAFTRRPACSHGLPRHHIECGCVWVPLAISSFAPRTSDALTCRPLRSSTSTATSRTNSPLPPLDSPHASTTSTESRPQARNTLQIGSLYRRRLAPVIRVQGSNYAV